MNIDLSKLPQDWLEDADCNIVQSADQKPKYYHIMHPLSIFHRVYAVRDFEVFGKCRHSFDDLSFNFSKYDNTTTRITITCNKCGGELSLYISNKDAWNLSTYDEMYLSHTDIEGSQDLIMAMANSGDYTLTQTIQIVTTACERCNNVLRDKYLHDGYPEFGEKWHKSRSSCQFCATTNGRVRKPNAGLKFRVKNLLNIK